MLLKFSGQQALSRKYVNGEGKWRVNSKPENPLNFNFELRLELAPFDVQIAGLRGQRPSVGAFEYFDEENDKYLADRWPAKLTVHGTIDVPEEWLEDGRALNVARALLWFNDLAGAAPILTDQRAQVLGYRREFRHIPSPDILGRDRPFPANGYTETDAGEPLGPGFVTFDDPSYPLGVNSQYVWSEILKYPDRTIFDDDKVTLTQKIEARVRHFNSHSELRDSKRYVESTDAKPSVIKAAVMAAASATEACLKHCIEANHLTMPKGYASLPFDEKIEMVLVLAGHPSFKQLEPEHARNLLYLYRARNARHEGDCYYRDNGGYKVSVKTIEQVRHLVDSTHTFIFWMDTLV